MRCPTCADTAHPGFIVWRKVEIRDGVYRYMFCPCLDCRGSAMASCDDGIVETWRDVSNARDIELVDEASAAPGEAAEGKIAIVEPAGRNRAALSHRQGGRRAIGLMGGHRGI